MLAAATRVVRCFRSSSTCSSSSMVSFLRSRQERVPPITFMRMPNFWRNSSTNGSCFSFWIFLSCSLESRTLGSQPAHHRLSPRMNLQSLLIEFCCSRSLRATSTADLVMPNWVIAAHQRHGGRDYIIFLRMELHRDDVRKSLRRHEVLMAVCSLESSVIEFHSEPGL
jgi:hypothetical protein